jgi:hypothetical protein
MNYDVYGGFEIIRKGNRTGEYDKTFWDQVEDVREGLSGACGCYVFALKNGASIKPWYVGKAEKQTFLKECFSPAKRLIFNDVLLEKNGTPLLFFLPRMTPKKKFCRPTIFKTPDIRFLENMLIGMALEQNAHLSNIKQTKILREMCVPGIINSPHAAPKLPVRELRNALGLSD